MEIHEMSKTGLWKAVDKNGHKYYRATLKGKKIFIFENKFKKRGTNQPDAFLYESKREIKPNRLGKFIISLGKVFKNKSS